MAFLALWLATQSRPALTITPSSRLAQPGSVIVLTIATAEPVGALTVRAFDRELVPYAVDRRQWRVLVGLDLEPALGDHPVAIESPAGSAVHPLHVTARRFRERRLTVDEAFVNPPPEVQARIEQEARRLQDLWNNPSVEKLWSGPFARPVPDAANSAFGTRSILNGQPRSPHGGADFLSATGTPIKSPSAGRVVLAGDRYYTGNTVMIDHGLQLFSLFAHLSEIQVKVGDTVSTSDVIGKVGATGRVTGPHLHWSVRLNGTRVDPLSLLAVLGSEPARK